MRIYEISQSYHVDLAKIVAIRQHYEEVRDPERGSSRFKSSSRFSRYEAWIEITIESGRHIEVDCASLDAMHDIYEMMLQAWKCYVRDYGEQPMLYETVNHDNNN